MSLRLSRRSALFATAGAAAALPRVSWAQDASAQAANDDAALAEAWRRVQGAVHPDRFAQAGDAQRRVAMQWAAQANEAIAVLRDPVRRGAYLAERRGSPVEAA